MNERSIGVIALSAHLVAAFTDKQIELVTTFADQAVIAIENAAAVRGGSGDAPASSRKHSNSKPRQRTCSSVISSFATFEVQPVFDSLVSNCAARFCECRVMPASVRHVTASSSARGIERG